MTTALQLAAQFPGVHFQEAEDVMFDCIVGRFIYVEVDEVCITDPFVSVCGRFQVDPWTTYKIPHFAAVELYRANTAMMGVFTMGGPEMASENSQGLTVPPPTAAELIENLVDICSDHYDSEQGCWRGDELRAARAALESHIARIENELAEPNCGGPMSKPDFHTQPWIGLVHIAGFSSEHCGGNIVCDYVKLTSGKVIVINGEVAVLFPSQAALEDPETDASDFPTWALYYDPDPLCFVGHRCVWRGRYEEVAAAVEAKAAPGVTSQVARPESRFFIDHGAVHDRATGQHVGMEAEPEHAERLLALLQELEGTKPMKLHFTNEWLRRKIASDPDAVEVEAGGAPKKRSPDDGGDDSFTRAWGGLHGGNE